MNFWSYPTGDVFKRFHSFCTVHRGEMPGAIGATLLPALMSDHTLSLLESVLSRPMGRTPETAFGINHSAPAAAGPPRVSSVNSQELRVRHIGLLSYCIIDMLKVG